MPIRMTDDKPENGGGSGGGDKGSGKALIALLIGILFFVFKYPKIGVPLVLVAGGLLWWLGSGEVTGGKTAQGRYAMGASLDEKRYDKALVQESLAVDLNNLPPRASLEKWIPKRRNQGKQGSCVGWATSYAARTILYARQSGKKPDDVVFSPAYVFNQIAGADCDGSHTTDALKLMMSEGTAPLGKFPYSPASCDQKPAASVKKEAAPFRIEGFQRLSQDAKDYKTNIPAIKQNLAQEAPVVISMQVGGSFYDLDKALWQPTAADKKSRDKWGGHAMTVIGYDDARDGGAFQIMNSWGESWGDRGLFWIRYPDFEHFVRQAYGLYPEGATRNAGTQTFRFGLIDNATKKNIRIAKAAGNIYRTVTPIKKGTRFKVEVSNSIPVYAYIFGQETNGSSYVLFPYTAQHSPYCPTKGTRVFPRNQSLEADAKGDRDSIAVVLSPKELDYNALNKKISAGQGGYAQRLNAALAGKLSTKAVFGAGGDRVDLSSTETNMDLVNAMVIEFDKK